MHHLESFLLPPAPKLRNLVHHYEVFDLKGRFPEEGLTIFPSLTIGLLFAFYRKQRVKVRNEYFGELDMYPTTLVPPTDKVAHNYDLEDLSVLRVVFVPGALSQLYEVPIKLFTNKLLEFPTVLDPELVFLHERMQERNTPSARIDLFEDYVVKKLAGKTISPRLYTATCRVLQDAPADWSAQHMADRLGLSRRHLNRKFNEAFGVPVKTFLQINRFCSVLRYLHARQVVSLSDTAYQFGYADQAHFSHEFKTMIGQSPKKHLQKIGKKAFPGPLQELEYQGFLMADQKGR